MSNRRFGSVVLVAGAVNEKLYCVPVVSLPDKEPPGPWIEHARCRGMDPTIWFPDRGHNTGSQRAVLICRTCPVMAECGDWAVRNKEKFGVWGGMTEDERRRHQQRPPQHPRQRRHAVVVGGDPIAPAEKQVERLLKSLGIKECPEKLIQQQDIHQHYLNKEKNLLKNLRILL